MNNFLSDEGSAFGRIAVSTHWHKVIILVHQLLQYDEFVTSFREVYEYDKEQTTTLVYREGQTTQTFLVQLEQFLKSQLAVSGIWLLYM